MKPNMELVEAQEVEVSEGAPESGPRAVNLESFQRRANEGRRRAAQLFAVQPGGAQGALKAHADPFGRAIEAEIEDEVA